jgi:hypothetical protein
MRSENMVGALDQQRTQVDVSGLGDAELWIAVAGLAAPRPQTEITAHIPASLEAFLAAQRQNIGECRQLAHAIIGKVIPDDTPCVPLASLRAWLAWDRRCGWQSLASQSSFSPLLVCSLFTCGLLIR